MYLSFYGQCNGKLVGTFSQLPDGIIMEKGYKPQTLDSISRTPLKNGSIEVFASPHPKKLVVKEEYHLKDEKGELYYLVSSKSLALPKN